MSPQTEGKPIPIPKQADRLLRDYPGSAICRQTTESLVWQGNVRPCPLSPTYYAELRYVLGRWPCVYVLAPALRSRAGRPPPHRYEDGSLCTFDSRLGHGEWKPWMWLSKTLLPWTQLWLFYYETWLATGVWSGAEVKH